MAPIIPVEVSDKQIITLLTLVSSKKFISKKVFLYACICTVSHLFICDEIEDKRT